MQEVCSSLESQMSAQIKSETTLNNVLPVQNNQQSLVPGVLTTAPAQVVQQTAAMLVNKMANNCDKRLHETPPYWMASEGGFINSQPSMAEFLNHLSPESPKIVGVGGGGTTIAGYTVGPITQTNDAMDSVPEYPWMKEKKTSRKNTNNNNQGKPRKHNR